MKHVEKGVVGDSYINFAIPSEFAHNALYCCTQVGHFYCDQDYDVRREYYDWLLMAYVCRGSLAFEVGGQTFLAREKEVALLDCRQSHRYYCPGSAEFLWFHFYGNSSDAYAQYLRAQNSQDSIVFTGERVGKLRQLFSSILSEVGSVFVNEHIVSRDIGNILCALAVSRRSSPLLVSQISPALNYIFTHFSEPVDLDLMAELCMLSKPHLIRSFRKYLGCTPHDYLMNYRLREAQRMLSGSASSVEKIAEICGFNSVSHFSRAFKKRIGMSPSEFRDMW